MAASPSAPGQLATTSEAEVPLPASPVILDTRTVDGKPLYIHVTILEPEISEKDGEKFMVYPLSTDVRESRGRYCSTGPETPNFMMPGSSRLICPILALTPRLSALFWCAVES